MQQHAAILKQIDDGRVGLPDFLAVVLGQAFADETGRIHAGGGVEVVLKAGDEIFRAVGGGSVDNARARVHGDVVGQHAEHIAIEKRMAKIDPLQFAPGEASDLLRPRKVALFDDSIRQLRGDDVHLATATQPLHTLHPDGMRPPSKQAASKAWWSR